MARSEKRIKWPDLPLIVHGAGGSIAVVQVEKVEDVDGVEVEGTWAPDTRTIEVTRTLPPRQKWHILFHEIMHAILGDSGLVNLLADESQEALCDAVATARVVEKAGELSMAARDATSVSPG